MSSCHNSLNRFEFTPADIADAVKNKRLLSMEVEYSLRCNLRCPYCYLPDKEALKNELSREEVRDAILQAKELGARKIIILGGEPMLYPGMMEEVRFIREEDLEVELFTNGFHITEDAAKKLYDFGVHVVLKMNSFNPDIQDKLTGKKDSSILMRAALENLKKAGYPKGHCFLAISTIICKDNVDELPAMWEWIKDQGFVPYYEIITPQGSANENDWLAVDTPRLQKLFEDIAEIDRKKYNVVWEAQPPLVGSKCLRHQFSCLLNARGYVMPCVGVNIPLGNIREKRLKDILNDSEVIEDLRDYKNKIKGPCRTCDKSADCYGCRGAAYQLTGDYLASDPLCWRNTGKEIPKLPMNVADIIPQKFSMRLIDTLESIGDRKGVISAVVDKDGIFIDDQGFLDEAAYIEIIAQAIAAMGAFKELGKEASKTEGFLLGIKKLTIYKRAFAGDKLKIDIFKEGSYGDFAIIQGSISCADAILAEGEIKVWHRNRRDG